VTHFHGILRRFKQFRVKNKCKGKRKREREEQTRKVKSSEVDGKVKVALRKVLRTGLLRITARPAEDSRSASRILKFSTPTMLDFYQNLNINSGLLQDQCPEKNSLGCGQAGKLAQTEIILDELRKEKVFL
jgi:hypothetical protein